MKTKPWQQLTQLIERATTADSFSVGPTVYFGLYCKTRNKAHADAQVNGTTFGSVNHTLLKKRILLNNVYGGKKKLEEYAMSHYTAEVPCTGRTFKDKLNTIHPTGFQ